MLLETLSRSEVLERAASIRAALPEGTPSVINPADSAILAKAEMISRERKSFGISSVLDSLTSAIRGERAAAEAALDRARSREAAIERLLTQQAGLERAIELETVALQRIEDLSVKYKTATSPASEATTMLGRFYARHDARFEEHLGMAVAGVSQNRLVAEALPSYAKQCRSMIASLEAELAVVAKQITKLK